MENIIYGLFPVSNGIGKQIIDSFQLLMEAMSDCRNRKTENGKARPQDADARFLRSRKERKNTRYRRQASPADTI